MNEIAIPAKMRPEETLARLHTREPLLVEALMMRLDVRPDDSVSFWSADERIAQALESNRNTLQNLPSDEEVKPLVEAVTKALAKCSEPFIRSQVAQLIGAFPNANPTDPETYISALVFDLLDSRIPDAVLYLACQEIRRTARFVPAISEVLQAATRHLEKWQQVLEIPVLLPQAREKLQFAISNVEATRDHREAHQAKQAKLIDEQRHSAPAASQPDRPGHDYTKRAIHYPSLGLEFEGDQQMLDAIAGLNSTLQCQASVKLVREGRAAAEALIRSHRGVEA